ncbi:hypothetical protein [Massilia scottii]|uniref:hypothetical protein n=1 Tax=Massilia scottii TaxID=3057166 RepID=UPI002796407A|nr:hypothetical protein [Massilia sp. CCM 9029]MDQ1832684.1 hypothetical protein [Massilia sp. CCM 9029]
MKKTLIMVAAILALSACASSGPPPPPTFIDATATTLSAPPADKAQIIFLQPKNLMMPLAAVGIYDVTDTDMTLLSMLPTHSKSVHLVTPGAHRFMAAYGAHNYLMDANVEAGKRYYVVARFIYGMGFQLRPIRTSGKAGFSVENPDFAAWVSKTRFVEKSPEADLLHAKYKVGNETVKAAAIADLLKKTPEQRAELTLNKEDAIAQ